MKLFNYDQKQGQSKQNAKNMIQNEIKQSMKKYLDAKYFNTCLGQEIHITQKSINETAHCSRMNPKTKTLIPFIPYILINAITQQDNIQPESNKQTKDFKFKTMSIMTWDVQNTGTAKVVVGFKNNNKAVLYSITKI